MKLIKSNGGEICFRCEKVIKKDELIINKASFDTIYFCNNCSKIETEEEMDEAKNNIKKCDQVLKWLGGNCE